MLLTGAHVAAPLSPNPEQHIRGEQQHCYLPSSDRSHLKSGVKFFSKKISPRIWPSGNLQKMTSVSIKQDVGSKWKYIHNILSISFMKKTLCIAGQALLLS